MFDRYAVYWAPDPEDALDRFARAWFAQAPAPWVAAPRRYGLHATLRAPFRPAPGVDRARVAADVRALAARLGPVVAPPLSLHTGARFLSLRPAGPSPALDHLAAAVVRGTDHLRAPLSDADRARRAAAGLSAAQARLLDRWGYPYVMEEFRFHITLSGPLDTPEAARAAAALRTRLPPLDAPFRVGRLWLFGDPGGGAAFEVLEGVTLGGD